MNCDIFANAAFFHYSQNFNRSGAPPESGEVAWNTYLKRRVSNHDTHRGDALKASAVLPTMWYRKWELFPAAGSVVRPSYVREVVSNRTYNLISDYGGHLFSTSGRYACGIKYDTHEGGKSMEMNSVMATEIVAAEVEHIVLPQIVSIKQASRMLGLPPYYLRRLCKEVPGPWHFSPASSGTSTWGN